MTLSGTSSLRVGERLISWSDDGLLAAEYALFDPSEIVLHASDPVTVREAGYMTTARQALDRLTQGGATLGVATAAAKALRGEAVVSFARGPSARAVGSHLGAQELFDGAIYRGTYDTPCYEGTWLDLRSLSQHVDVPNAPILIQALHLTATLAEVAGDTPLHLSTRGTQRRPGERTYHKPALAGVVSIPEALRKLRPRTMPIDVDPARDARLHPALLARVRERMSRDTPPRLRAHLARLEKVLTELTKPAGPMDDDELRAIERQLDARDLEDVADWIRRIERVRGNIPAIRYLQARLALLTGEEPPGHVAQRLTEISDEDRRFHEATLVAARTWLAAGEGDQARSMAHRLADDPTARDSERLMALEILWSMHHPDDQEPSAAEGSDPPDGPDAPRGEAHVEPPPHSGVDVHIEVELPPDSAPATERDAHVPSTTRMPHTHAVHPGHGHSGHTAHLGPTAHSAAHPGHRRTPAPTIIMAARPTPNPRVPRNTTRMTPARGAHHTPHIVGLGNLPPPKEAPHPTAPPPPLMLPPGPARTISTRMPAFYQPELVESLALPVGSNESDLGVNERPTTTAHARIAMIRLARDLARDYRLWYGKALRCDVIAIDGMQQHLTQRYAGASITDEEVAWELRRHGALLSEILARKLGGGWVDVTPSEPGYWAMQLGAAMRTHPIGRVYRFVSLGHRERDLVSYFIDLETKLKER
jgi:hypothetical protein